MQVGQVFKGVPSPAELAAGYAAGLKGPHTQPRPIELDGRMWRVVGATGRHGHTVLVTENGMAAKPARATLELSYVVLTEDGGEESETGRYDATVTKFDPEGHHIQACGSALRIGQVFKHVPSPAELGTLFGASFEPPCTPPTITLDGQELYIYELSRFTRNTRSVGGDLRVVVGPRAEQLEDRPTCAKLTIGFVDYDEDGPEYDEGNMPAEPGYYVAIVEEVEPGFALTTS